MSVQETNFVEEFPRPPRYYECFRVKDNQLVELNMQQPPPIPEIVNREDLYAKLYEGAFARSRLPSMGASITIESIDDNVDYKSEIKSAFRQILSNSLPLLSLPTLNPSDIQMQASTVRASITELYKLLARYRRHEARVSIYHQMQKQLESAKRIEGDLQRKLVEYQALLQEIEKSENYCN